MQLHQLSAGLAVSGQIEPDDVQQLAEAGFKVLVNNRPDEEVEDTINHRAMAAAADTAGMEYHYLPFYPGQVTPELISDFARITAGIAPVFAYCRTGNRCTVLWALSQAGKLPESEILAAATEAGYDLEPVRPLLASLANKRRS